MIFSVYRELPVVAGCSEQQTIKLNYRLWTRVQISCPRRQISFRGLFNQLCDKMPKLYRSLCRNWSPLFLKAVVSFLRQMKWFFRPVALENPGRLRKLKILARIWTRIWTRSRSKCFHFPTFMQICFKTTAHLPVFTPDTRSNSKESRSVNSILYTYLRTELKFQVTRF